MFDNLFGTEAGPVVNYLFAFILVIVLILLVAWLFRRFVSRGDLSFGPRTGQRRLAVVEASGVDAQRRLILVRRDEVEHLLLIGGPTDIVVEANIGQEARKAARPAPQPQPAAAPAAAQRPRPPVREPRPAPQPAPAQPAAPHAASPQAMPQRPVPPRPMAAPEESAQRPRFGRPVEPSLEPRQSTGGDGRTDPFLRTPPLTAEPREAEPSAQPRRYGFETPAEKETGRIDRPGVPPRGERDENG